MCRRVRIWVQCPIDASARICEVPRWRCNNPLGGDAKLRLPYHYELAGILDHDRFGSLPTLRTDTLNCLDHVQSFKHLSEDNMPTVEPRCLDSADEELRSIGAWARIGHGEDSWPGVLELEILISELFSINR